jgi:HPt (histidine-containing phosphotransfer) domain-containing protein
VTFDDVPILDAAVLAELRESTGDDDAFLLELVEAYAAEGQGDLDAMIAAAASGDAGAIVRPAHTLKSSSASLGAMRMAAISKRIEEAGRGGGTGDLAADVEAARTTWTATLAALADAGLTP